MDLRRWFFFALVLTGISGIRIFALDVDGWAPIINNPSAQGALNAAFDTIKGSIGAEIMDIYSTPEKLIRSFADASVFTHAGATQRAFEGYEWFAFTLGTMAGVVLPGSRLNADAFSSIGDTLKDKGDVPVGLNIQFINAQISVNTSPFLLENLYLGLKFGYFNTNAIDNFKYEVLQIGALGNYQIIRGFTFVPNRFSWRGLSLGSGLIFQRTNAQYQLALDSYKETFDVTAPGSNDGILAIQPELVLDMTINTFVVPMEANTSFQILFFNINFGLGMDLAFGKNHLSMSMAGPVEVSGPGGLTMVTPSYLTVDGGGDISPSIINPKLMFDLGFKFGPVFLDIPVTYYFLMGYGLNLGITLGVVW
jgi:hypothetical protein